jgi:hypothetical protein
VVCGPGSAQSRGDVRSIRDSDHEHPRPRPTCVSLATNEFDEQCEDDFSLRLKRITRVRRRSASGKAVLGERFEEQGGIAIRLRARNAVNMRVI